MTPTPLSPKAQVPQPQKRLGKLRATLWAIENSLDDGEMRQAAHDALEADDDLAAAELALSALPINQVVQEPPEGYEWREDAKAFVRHNANGTDSVYNPLPDIARELNVMLGSAIQHGNEDWITGYTIKTGALHRILGFMQAAGHSVVIPNGLAASPQPVSQPGEALPAEQPKSDKENLESASGGNDLQTALPDTGDHVHHAPSGEDWVVAYVRGDKLCACGWPCTLADLSDCTIIKKATPAERHELLLRMADMDGGDSRGAYARERLSRAACEARAGEVPSNKKAPESSSAAPVEAVEVLRELVESAAVWKHGMAAAEVDAATIRYNAAWDRARTLVAQPPQAVQEVRNLRKLTPDDARQLLCVRDHLDAGKINDAVYALTAFADPEMGKENPWEDIEQLAAISATTKQEN